MEHGFQGQFIVDAIEVFHTSVSDEHLGIRASLCAAVAVTTACVGHIALAAVYIEQRPYDVSLSVRGDKRKQRRGGAIGVPDGIIVIIIWSIRPFGILASAVDRHEYGVIEYCIKHAFLLL